MFQATAYLAQNIPAPRDRLVLVTDRGAGSRRSRPEFDEQRLAGLLLATTCLTPHQWVAEVLRTLRSYAPRMHDDATVICLDWNGPPPPPSRRDARTPDSDA